MGGTTRCPRCDGAVRAPSIWHSGYTCAAHGEVVPLQPPHPADAEHLAWIARHSDVPVWLPWPLPDGWLVTGTRCVRDDKHEAQGVVVAVSGPHHGPPGCSPVADLLLVAEQPGTGLGAHLAGRGDLDPGDGLVTGRPAARLHAAGAAAPLWPVPAADDAARADDRTVLVGEAGGVWLWALLWPGAAGVDLLDDLELVDLRDPAHELDVPCGALSPRLRWADREVPAGT
ncbi:DUF6758 family protein [Kineococcus sp. LSe6-4]|uniref:DUF6758 family protein n=1 Tax=Kineococcus halophytocola TaxID=3234027 RepID=A0ABV4GZE2_9ACTN